jgi:hypothetical protein
MNAMSKQTITKIWIAGLVVLAIGLVVGGVGIGLMLAYGGHFTPSGPNSYNFVPTLDGFFWTTVVLMAIGFAIAIAGGILQLAAWIGALVNTNQLQDKTWFIVLLVGGLVGFSVGLVGFAAMVAYLVAGPDGLAPGQAGTPPRDLRPALAHMG